MCTEFELLPRLSRVYVTLHLETLEMLADIDVLDIRNLMHRRMWPSHPHKSMRKG